MSSPLPSRRREGLALIEEIRKQTVRLLRPLEPPRATLRLVRWPDGSLAVTKDYYDASPLYRLTVGRFLIGREVAAYRRLQGVPGLPRLLARPTPYLLALEFIPGTEVGALAPGALPEVALGQLRETLEAIHRAGILHLDLGRLGLQVLGGDQGRGLVRVPGGGVVGGHRRP